MKTKSIKNAPDEMVAFLDEVTKPDNAFSNDGKPYIKFRLVCGALAFWILTMIRSHINEAQYQAYENGSNADIFRLAVAYLRAKRGVKGYWIDRRKIVHGKNLKQEIIKEQ